MQCIQMIATVPAAEWIGAGASVCTCIGVMVAGFQLFFARRGATTAFEDLMSREYRELARRLPVKFLLGKNPSAGELDQEDTLSGFFHYVDLSNEQVFLRKSSRISEATWREWRDGIRSTLALPAFGQAWERIKTDLPGSFQELRQLEKEEFRSDPRDWRHE